MNVVPFLLTDAAFATLQKFAPEMIEFSKPTKRGVGGWMNAALRTSLLGAQQNGESLSAVIMRLGKNEIVV